MSTMLTTVPCKGGIISHFNIIIIIKMRNFNNNFNDYYFLIFMFRATAKDIDRQKMNVYKYIRHISCHITIDNL